MTQRRKGQGAANPGHFASADRSRARAGQVTTKFLGTTHTVVTSGRFTFAEGISDDGTYHHLRFQNGLHGHPKPVISISRKGSWDSPTSVTFSTDSGGERRGPISPPTAIIYIPQFEDPNQDPEDWPVNFTSDDRFAATVWASGKVLEDYTSEDGQTSVVKMTNPDGSSRTRVYRSNHLEDVYITNANGEMYESHQSDSRSFTSLTLADGKETRIERTVDGSGVSHYIGIRGDFELGRFSTNGEQ